MRPGAPGLAVEDLPGGVLVFEDGGKVLLANAALEQMLGHAPGSLAGQPVGALFSPAGRVLYHTAVYPVLKLNGRIEETHLLLRCQDGSDLPTLCSFRMEAQADGGRQVIGLVMGMQERKRYEEELLRTRRIAEQVPGVLLQLVQRPDGSACIPYASEAMRELFGVAPIAVRHDATPLLAAVHAEDRAALVRTLVAAGAALAPWTQRFRSVGRAGALRWLDGHAVPDPRRDGSLVWHGYIQDVSERLAMEQALREKDAAERANRAKSEFLARISHELRTPLNGILGFAQLLGLDRAAPLAGEQRSRVGHIETAGRHLLRLIDEVLDITRIEAGAVQLAPAPVELDGLLAEALRLVELLAGERRVALQPAPACGLVIEADRARLLQALINLLSNAVKYNRPDGWVRVTVALETGAALCIGVADSGIGLSPAQRLHLFEPFNRLGAEHTPTEGTGLGLVITRRLVELMHGTLRVDSSPGAGSVFTVALPAACVLQAAPVGTAADPPAAAAAAADVAPAAVAQLAAPRPRRVLYVEDNEVNVLLMRAIFGYRPAVDLQVAGSGSAALATAERCPPELLLLDMNLPDGDGLALLAQLRRLPGLGEVPAVAVSADAMRHHIERSRAGGFDAYWTKPLDVTETLARLDALLA